MSKGTIGELAGVHYHCERLPRVELKISAEEIAPVACALLLCSRRETLVCPHCQTLVSGRANVCAGCGAEIVRGPTGRERSLVGLLFVLGAIPLLGVIWRAVEIGRGSSTMPDPRSGAAYFIFLGLIIFFVCAYITGKCVARLFRRSQIRFFRSYRHQ